MLSRTTPALAAALLLAAAVPTAAHARFFEGETARGGEVTLDADDNGRPPEVTVRWRTRCHGRTVAALTALTIPPQTSRPRTFSVVRTDTIGLARGRYDAIVESAVRGASHGAGARTPSSGPGSGGGATGIAAQSAGPAPSRPPSASCASGPVAS